MTPEEIGKFIGDWCRANEPSPTGLARVIAEQVRIAIAAEREACARLAYNHPTPAAGASWRESIGAAIRVRGAS